MKRRNAESGKRRSNKRTKITERILYGNSMLYLKFMILWTTVVLADYMMDFRFEFLWPLWTMLLTVNDSFKYKGIVYSMFFMGIALSSDVICYLFIPLQYIFFAASTHVWVQYIWYTFADKGVCWPTAALCVMVVYVEAGLRNERGPGVDLCRPLAAHCLGYPIVILGFGVKSLIELRCRLRRLGQARVLNELYIELLKDTLPDGTAEQLAKIEQHLASQVISLNNGTANTHNLDLQLDTKVVSKSLKSEKKDTSSAKEEKRKNKNKDKDRDSGDKSTDQKIYKDLESTKEVVKNHKDSNGFSNKEDKEQREREREREKERDKELREREREKREARECAEELERVRAELEEARAAESEARRELATALAHLDKQLSTKVTPFRCAEKAALEKKLSEARKARAHAENQLLRAKTTTPNNGECENEWCKSRSRAQQTETLSLRRDVQKTRDKAARLNAELHAASQQVRNLEARNLEARNAEEAASARGAVGSGAAAAVRALQERAAQLDRALSAETRVKLDLLSALGEAKRTLHWQDDLISRQEKEIEELKAQMLAVMPTEYVTPLSSQVSALRFPEGRLNPNATVYTPR